MIKNIPLKKLLAIQANGYLGEHDKKGKQKDYTDHRFEIDQRIWDLQNQKQAIKIKESLDLADRSAGKVDLESELNEFISMTTKKPLYDFEKIFNPWAYLSKKLTIDMH